MFCALMLSLVLMSAGGTGLAIAVAARLVRYRVNSQYYIPGAALALLIGLALFVTSVVIGIV